MHNTVKYTAPSVAMYSVDVPDANSESKNGWKTLFVLNGSEDAKFAAMQFSTLEKYGKVASMCHMGTDERHIFLNGKEPSMRTIDGQIIFT